MTGSVDPHISHSRREGWLRNVHVGQGRELSLRLRDARSGVAAPELETGVGMGDGDGEDESGGAGVCTVEEGSERDCMYMSARANASEFRALYAADDKDGGGGTAIARGAGDTETDEGTESRGTPQSAQTRRAAGESPGGLRYAQIAHSQLAQGSSASTAPKSVLFCAEF